MISLLIYMLTINLIVGFAIFTNLESDYIWLVGLAFLLNVISFSYVWGETFNKPNKRRRR